MQLEEDDVLDAIASTTGHENDSLAYDAIVFEEPGDRIVDFERPAEFMANAGLTPGNITD